MVSVWSVWQVLFWKSDKLQHIRDRLHDCAHSEHMLGRFEECHVWSLRARSAVPPVLSWPSILLGLKVKFLPETKIKAGFSSSDWPKLYLFCCFTFISLTVKQTQMCCIGYRQTANKYKRWVSALFLVDHFQSLLGKNALQLGKIRWQFWGRWTTLKHTRNTYKSRSKQ